MGVKSNSNNKVKSSQSQHKSNQQATSEKRQTKMPLPRIVPDPTAIRHDDEWEDEKWKGVDLNNIRLDDDRLPF